MRPPLVKRKLIPFASSRELPPPNATSESISSGAAKARPASTISQVGLLSKSWNRRVMMPAAFSVSSAVDMTGADDSAIGDEQGSTEAQFARELAEPLRGVIPDHEPGARTKVELQMSLRCHERPLSRRGSGVYRCTRM